jgi:hypothetical protein
MASVTPAREWRDLARAPESERSTQRGVAPRFLWFLQSRESPLATDDMRRFGSGARRRGSAAQHSAAHRQSGPTHLVACSARSCVRPTQLDGRTAALDAAISRRDAFIGTFATSQPIASFRRRSAARRERHRRLPQGVGSRLRAGQRPSRAGAWARRASEQPGCAPYRAGRAPHRHAARVMTQPPGRASSRLRVVTRSAASMSPRFHPTGQFLRVVLPVLRAVLPFLRVVWPFLRGVRPFARLRTLLPLALPQVVLLCAWRPRWGNSRFRQETHLFHAAVTNSPLSNEDIVERSPPRRGPLCSTAAKSLMLNLPTRSACQ